MNKVKLELGMTADEMTNILTDPKLEDDDRWKENCERMQEEFSAIRWIEDRQTNKTLIDDDDHYDGTDVVFNVLYDFYNITIS